MVVDEGVSGCRPAGSPSLLEALHVTPDLTDGVADSLVDAQFLAAFEHALRRPLEESFHATGSLEELGWR